MGLPTAHFVLLTANVTAFTSTQQQQQQQQCPHHGLRHKQLVDSGFVPHARRCPASNTRHNLCRQLSPVWQRPHRAWPTWGAGQRRSSRNSCIHLWRGQGSGGDTRTGEVCASSQRATEQSQCVVIKRASNLNLLPEMPSSSTHVCIVCRGHICNLPPSLPLQGRAYPGSAAHATH